MAWPERFQRALKLDSEMLGSSPKGHPQGTFSPQIVFDYIICPHAEFEARCRLALTALEIERFRNGHGGRLPDSLEELAQEMKLEALVDPFNGLPLRFQKLPKGYRLHSVGADGVDNDGVSATQNSWYGGPPLSGTDISFSVER